MQSVDTLIINGAQVVTCATGGKPKRGSDMRDVGLIEDGGIALAGGRIVAVDKTSAIRAAYTAEQVIDATGMAVIPGLVDCHTHTVFAGSRLDEFELRIQGKTYMEIMAAGGGILSTMRATRAATLPDLIAAAEVRLRTMLSLGTTTVEIKTGYGLDTDSEVKMLQAIAAVDARLPLMIIPTFLGAHTVPPEHASADSYAEYLMDEMLPAIDRAYRQTHFAAGDNLLFVDVFCEEGVFDLDTSRRILQTCRDDWGLPVKAHVDEFVNLGGVPMAVALKAVSVDHLDVTPPEELSHLARSDTVGVMLPAVNFNLGNQQYGNARHLIDSGGILALSTDYNPGSAPTFSLPMIMALACRYQKLLPSEALNTCTINAAAALGLTRKIGSLERGKRADIVILAVPDYRALAYEFGASMIRQVFIEGESVWMTSS